MNRSTRQRTLLVAAGIALTIIIAGAIISFLVAGRGGTTDAWKLGEMLGRGEFSVEEGNRILEKLMQPTVLVRGSYAQGEPAFAIAKRGSGMSFRLGTMNLTAEITYPDRRIDVQSWPNYGGFSDRTRLAILPFDKPGDYAVNVAMHAIIQPARWRTRLEWPSRRPFPKLLLPQRLPVRPEKLSFRYRCTVEFPITLKIVPPGQEAKPRLVSNPELDAKMKALFTGWMSPGGEMNTTRLFGSSGRCDVKYRGMHMIRYGKLPENCGFREFFRDADGKEYQGHLVGLWKKGTEGTTGWFPTCFNPQKSGTYTGTMILRPTFEAIADHPEVSQIWGGTLEFPVTVQITVSKIGN